MMVMMMMMMMVTVVTVMVIADADDDDDDDDGQLREANFGQIWNLFLGILGRFPTPVSDEVPSSKTSVENCATLSNPDPNRADQGESIPHCLPFAAWYIIDGTTDKKATLLPT